MAGSPKFTTAQLALWTGIAVLIGLGIGYAVVELALVTIKPPVIIVGGSIFGQTPTAWLPYNQCGVTDQLEWCYPVGSSQDHLYSVQYTPALSLSGVSSNTSWTVQITDKNPNNSKAGVLLCGNADCNVNAKSDLNNVYIRPSDENDSHSKWVNIPTNYLFYQDKTCALNGNCEHPDKAILTIASGQVNPPSQCTAPENIGCSIAVGTASVKHP
jgi:hypothetical protein